MRQRRFNHLNTSVFVLCGYFHATSNVGQNLIYFNFFHRDSRSPGKTVVLVSLVPCDSDYENNNCVI